MAGSVEGFNPADMDGLLRDQELNLLLQGCLCFYFTLIPQEGRGRGGAEPPALCEAGPGWLSRFPSSSAGPIQQSP